MTRLYPVVITCWLQSLMTKPFQKYNRYPWLIDLRTINFSLIQEQRALYLNLIFQLPYLFWHHLCVR